MGQGNRKGASEAYHTQILAHGPVARDPKQDQLTRTLSILLDQQPAAQLVITL